METRIVINYTPSNDPELFGAFSLSFIDYTGDRKEVKLKLDIKELWEFSRDTSSVSFDFLILSFLVYNVDRAVSRINNSLDGWHRCLILEEVPVLNLHEMNKSRKSLINAISFLTGDTWDIHFVQALPYNYLPAKKVRYFNAEDYEQVALFSGGLDSLIGFIDEVYALSHSKKVLLISHMELGKEHKDQEDILGYCNRNSVFTGKYDRLLINAGLKHNSWNIRTIPESTFRARSLLFFASGIYAASHINPTIPLIVPENGTISLNIPLDKGRRSACSTRTTHPTFIKRLEEAMTQMGITNTFINPYKYKSKADMMMCCYNQPSKRSVLLQLTQLSCSCAKRGHNSFWDKSSAVIKQSHITHCGMCLPCLYRRVALDTIGLDNPSFWGTDVLNGTKYDLSKRYQKRNRDFRALLYFIKYRLTDNVIRRELIINGVTEETELSKYVELVKRSYNQVKEWLDKKAPSHIKHLAGL